MFRDCPHRGEKGRIVHNIQQAETMEDMGRKVPMIYAALDNKQAEYHAHMIEVERASHSYIDSKMVESFHMPRRKHEKYWLVWLATGTKRKVNEMV
jgi:hypothetical protein